MPCLMRLLFLSDHADVNLVHIPTMQPCIMILLCAIVLLCTVKAVHISKAKPRHCDSLHGPLQPPA